MPLDAWKKNGPVISRISPVHGPAASSASTAAIRENAIRITGAASVPHIEARAEGRSHRGLVKPEDISAWLKQRGFPEKRLLPNTRWIYVSSIGGINGLHSCSVIRSNVQTINAVGRIIRRLLLFRRFFGDFFMWVLSFPDEALSRETTKWLCCYHLVELTGRSQICDRFPSNFTTSILG